MGDNHKVKRIRVALFASLAINLLVAGLLIGGHFAGEERRVRSAPTQFGLGPFLSALEDKDRKALGREVRAALSARGPRGPGMKQQLDRLADIVAAETFDANALAAQMQTQLDMTQNVHETVQQVVLARLSTMTLAERERVAQRLRDWSPKRRKADPGRRD